MQYVCVDKQILSRPSQFLFLVSFCSKSSQLITFDTKFDKVLASLVHWPQNLRALQQVK
jgi:hypothetical protein